jgi:glycosyltransferase involved in cell wall biosynthesis
MGDTPLNEIIAAYVSTPFDVFINTSRSEGIPVSLMEAMSCGIPCIAPKVGGIPELIDGKSGGKLISSEARPEEIVSACLEITASESEWRTRSEAAFTKWREDYDASKNLAHFAQIISKI